MVVTSEVVEERPYEELIDQTCPNCRQTIAWDTEVCPKCGWQIKGEAKPKKVEVKKAAPAKRKRKKGTATFAASIIALGALALFAYQYFPPAALIVFLIVVVMIALAAAPAE